MRNKVREFEILLVKVAKTYMRSRFEGDAGKDKTFDMDFWLPPFWQLLA